MTHPNCVTNGASLEDCHTNFFALSDLCGIKWKSWRSSDGLSSQNPLDDPVFGSYSKCLAADLLCVWRRIKKDERSVLDQQHGRTSIDQLSYPKELWVFWYGEEPDLNDLVSPELIESDIGSWESGLSYECRTLLFKALHNLIERCLICRGFARLGKWFVQPSEHVYDKQAAEQSNKKKNVGEPSAQLSFAFNFFVHGDSTVCASIDVRQHPTVYRLSGGDLQAHSIQSGTKVILAPYGLAGVLTGQSYKDSDPNVQKLLGEWKQIYPVTQPVMTGKENLHGLAQQSASLSHQFTGESCTEFSSVSNVNSVVEVVVSGFKMKYPSCFVFVTDLDLQRHALVKTGNALSKAANNLGNDSSVNLQTGPNACELESADSSSLNKKLEPTFFKLSNSTHLLKNTVSQELSLFQQKSFEVLSEDANSLWNVIDPCTKQNCNCFRCRTKRNAKSLNSGLSSQSLMGTHKKGEKFDKSQDKSQQKSQVKSAGLFHRRTPANDILLDISTSVSNNDSIAMSSSSTSSSTTTNTSSNISQPTSVPTYSYKSPISGGGLPSLQSNATTPTGGNGFDSPRSAAPSVNLEGPVPSIGEHTNLSLSPHPSKEDATAAACIEIQMATGNISQSPMNKERTHLEQLLSPNHSLASVKAIGSNNNAEDCPSVTENNQWTPGGQSASEFEGNPQSLVNTNNADVNGFAISPSPYSVNNSTNNQNQTHTTSSAVKRPFLALSLSDDFDCDSFRNGLLYDYSCLNDMSNGLDVPQSKIRRFKGYNASDMRRASVCDYNARKRMINSPGALANGCDLLDAKTKDPYEFSDFDEDTPSFKAIQNGAEEMVNGSALQMACNTNDILAMTMTCHSQLTKDTPKANLVSSEINIATSPQIVKGFTREDELVPSYRDLDQIFEPSSGEDSSDELFQTPLTPSGSNRAVNSGNCVPGTTIDDTKSSTKNGTGILGVAELTRMFPTPPSLEPMAPSPCTGPDAALFDELNGKNEIYSCSPLADSKDWSYVYKPPVHSISISSSKYAPLANIPSLSVQSPPQSIYKHSSTASILLNQQLQQQTPETSVNKSQLQSTNAKYPFGYQHLMPQNSTMPLVGAGQFIQCQSIQLRGPVGTLSPGHSSQVSFQQMPAMNIRLRQNLSFSSQQMQHPQLTNNFSQQTIQHNHQNLQQPSFVTPMDGTHPNAISNIYSNFSPKMDSGQTIHNQQFPNSFANQRIASQPNPNTLSVQVNMQQNQQNSFLARNLPSSDANSLQGIAEAHSLILNLLLSDSMLNLFKDHNFESCSTCVCNMNIKGSDVGIYLPEFLVAGADESQYRCSCGFSAVINRHRSQFAGLFYEDEIESTGIIYDPCDGLRKRSLVNQVNDSLKEMKENEVDNSIGVLVDLLITQCSSLLSTCSSLAKAIDIEILSDRYKEIVNLFSPDKTLNILRNPVALIFKDNCEVTLTALASAKLIGDNVNVANKLIQHHLNYALHEWPFRKTQFPTNNQEVIRLLKHLQPLMQESVQRKRTKMWEVTYTVSGPLTWRQFHRLAGRGTEDQCEPQPIPSLLVGYDKDWAALSPFALKYWEKLLLEPYSITRDIAYIVVAPDNPFLLSHVRTFFKELSTTYEMLRLGRHCPISKVLRDGILRVSKKLADEPVDDWFNQIGDSQIAVKLKMYAQACRYYLAPFLSQYSLDRSLFDLNSSKQSSESTNVNNSGNGLASTHKSHGSSPMNAPDAAQSDKPDDSQSDSTSNQSSQQAQTQDQDSDEDSHKQPAIVIYLIEPFTFGCLDKDSYRLASVGLMRCYAQMLRFVPEHLQNSIHLQLISLDSILLNEKNSIGASRQDQLKQLSLSIFSQCRQLMTHQSLVKSLTGFGPASNFDFFLKSKDPSLNMNRIFMPPFILAPLKDKQTELGEMFGDRREKSHILYCCYCLTEDQRWLLASCTNDKGDLLQSTCINIEIPNRPRRRKACVRKFALEKLMKFVMTILADSVQPWRLVIGRLGRIGHLELKEWASLLSKKSLLRYSKQLRETCSQCATMTPLDQPSIFSACLISLEADTALRVFHDQFTPDERFSSSCNSCSLSTPEDASCTHILVFPTSATTQSSHGNFSMDPLGTNLGEDDLLTALDDPDLRVEDDIDVTDIFQWTDNAPNSPVLGSPRRDGLSQPDSPGIRQNYCGSGSIKMSNGLGGDIQEEPLQLLQQPLALGFYVSTAKTGLLPRWFWSSCPQMESSTPVFLKSALLIHTSSVQQNSDDFLHSNIRNYHPLDSNLTTDVLRYVLEGYNALSWLSLDPCTHDRTSCLPVHIQMLMQLYHTIQALV